MIINIITLVILICFSAFFSGTEIAYSSVNRNRIKKSADDGVKTAIAADRILSNFETSLTSLLIGNNVVNIFSSSIATVVAIGLVGESGVVYATLVMTVVILIFGEIVPKVAAKQNNESFVNLTAYPFTAIAYITSPLARLAEILLKKLDERWGSELDSDDTVSADELVTIIETTEDEGVIDEDRSDLLQSAVEFADIQVQEILTPRVDLTAVGINDPIDIILETAMACSNSRLPVYDEDIDSIIGILSVTDLFRVAAFNPTPDIKPLLSPPLFIYKTLSLPEALDNLKESSQHMAIVTDEFGGVMGIVTVEDIIEELVGEIWDETDVVEEDFIELSDDSFEVLGDMNIYDLFEELEIDEEQIPEGINTASGFLIDRLGYFPSGGESVIVSDYEFTVTEIDGLRVEKLIVKDISDSD